MSFEWWANYETTETQKTSNDLKEVSTTEIENSSREMKEIIQAESEDLDDLQAYEEFFDSWYDTLELDGTIENWKDKETKTKEIQESLYEKLWINLELEQNPDIKKFVKWLLDWLIVNNLEEIEQLLESSINELVEMFELPKKSYADYKNKQRLIQLGVKTMRALGLERRKLWSI